MKFEPSNCYEGYEDLPTYELDRASFDATYNKKDFERAFKAVLDCEELPVDTPEYLERHKEKLIKKYMNKRKAHYEEDIYGFIATIGYLLGIREAVMHKHEFEEKIEDIIKGKL